MVDATSPEELSSKYRESYEKHRSSMKKPNILVAGGTGAGKSSLVNLVFGAKTAEVGAGQPVTRGIQRFDHPYAVLFDSEGYETGEESQARFRDAILSQLDDGMRTGKDAIHLVWYCISQAGHRVLDVDISTINSTKARRIPVCIVLSQADKVSKEESEALHELLQRDCPDVSIFETSTDASLPLDVDTIISWSAEHLEQGARSAFLAGVRGGVPIKKSEGMRIVGTHTVTAAGIAVNPIPLSDAPLLIANQVSMIARLATLWDLEAIKTASAGGIAGQALAIAGRSLAGNLLKLIPGVGSVAGAAINASVASAITGGVGYATNEICARIYADEINGTLKDIASYFDAEIVSNLVKNYLSSVTQKSA